MKTHWFCSQMHAEAFVYRSFLFSSTVKNLTPVKWDRKAKFSTQEFGQFLCVHSLRVFVKQGMKLKYNHVVSTYLGRGESINGLGFCYKFLENVQICYQRYSQELLATLYHHHHIHSIIRHSSYQHRLWCSAQERSDQQTSAVLTGSTKPRFLLFVVVNFLIEFKLF